MKKRTVRLGTYDTASHGWTLSGCVLSDPEQKTNYVERTGWDGTWDLSTVLTDGIPRYKDRTLTITLENSQGDRAAREKTISEMVNQLDGLEWNIVLPDYPDHYLQGRVRVKVNYSDLAHASVTISATCQPWLFKSLERVVILDAPTTASTETATFYLLNEGRKVVTPVLTLEGTGSISINNQTFSLKEGENVLPGLQLFPNEPLLIRYLGGSTGGTLTVTYREAVLR